MQCPHCGAGHIIPTHGSINVSDNPSIKEKVRDGSLFLWECPRCGGRNLAKYETLYHDPELKLMFWLRPEEGFPLTEQMEKSMDKLAFTEGLETYTLRRVSSVTDLIEKINIAEAGLDDVTIEMCKLVLKMETGEDSGQDLAEDIRDAKLIFSGMSGADNDIMLSFPNRGQIKTITIGFNVYEDCAGIIRRNPSLRPAPGFAVVDTQWLAGYFG